MPRHRFPRIALVKVGAGLTAAALLLAGCGTGGGGKSGSGDTIRVGVLASLTGYLATNDNAMAAGVRLAADTLNAQGGINGRKVSLDVVDVRSSASAAATALRQMVSTKHVDAVINGYLSAAVAAVAPTLKSNSVPMVATAVIPNDPWVFTVTPPVSSWVEAQASYLQTKLNASKIGILYSQTPYGQQIEKALRGVADRYHLQIVDAQGVASDATDISAQLIHLRQVGVDAIVDELFGAQHLVMAKNAAALGLRVPIVGGPDARATYEKATRDYPGLTFVAFPTQLTEQAISSPDQQKATSVFLKAWHDGARSADEPAFAGGQGWDAMMVLADAIRKSGDDISGNTLRGHLETNTVQGVTNKFTYSAADHSGQLSQPVTERPWAIISVRDGALTVVYELSKATQ